MQVLLQAVAFQLSRQAGSGDHGGALDLQMKMQYTTLRDAVITMSDSRPQINSRRTLCGVVMIVVVLPKSYLSQALRDTIKIGSYASGSTPRLRATMSCPQLLAQGPVCPNFQKMFKNLELDICVLHSPMPATVAESRIYISS